MYKKITKSMEASMMIGNWFASGYRTIDSSPKNRIKKMKTLLSGWMKRSVTLKK